MKNKFIVLLLTFVFVLSMSLVALADVDVKDSEGNVVATVLDFDSLVSDSDNYTILHPNDYNLNYLLVYDKGAKLTYNSSTHKFNLSSGSVKLYRYWTISQSPEWELFETASSDFCLSGLSGSLTFYYTTADIISSDGTVFLKAPKVGALQTVVKTINLGGVLSQVISLIPLVLLVVILYLALRKALNFVLARLRTS